MITLKTLPQATAQEVFDQVVLHLLAQGERSVGDVNGSRCLYRGSNGLKCAAGCLIGDDEYVITMEGWGWDSIVPEYGPMAHFHLILDLQGIHDYEDPDHWQSRLRSYAIDHDLSTEAVNAF